uniref:exodeoxyribonuclease III n=1 Tax=Pygocentrus nattereri TaxID=42514 RepID=A0AAR2JIC8_PYGNA
MSSLNFVSWNVKGIGHVVKRKKILTFLKKEKVSIALLQETHLSNTEHLKLKRDWVGQIYFSSFGPNRRGTAILVHKNVPFILEKEDYDPEGRYILVTGFIFGQHLTILNIYAPNEDCPRFMSRMVLLFNQHCKGFGLIAGDFNCILNSISKNGFTF